ncbi:nucleoside ABC transporter membrane protein [Microbacterium sp. SLBN-154]|uniref:ABC transporter permease n=1 Tax=Microbacterium sp. SLBN-154 TaxID=2768458 RepID=UPI0011508B1C|nr:ABC transporter permease [Microbacterium sp. SLBN-154]TQK18956.1 nucleoside ABC transporter membrane protein [Microbacterium sp. SLBN-154]
MSGLPPEGTNLGPGVDPGITRTAQGEPSVQTPVAEIPPPPRQNQIIREILRSNAVATVLAIVLAMLIGGVLVAFTNPEVQRTSGYFFARPQDTLVAIWDAVAGAYAALFRGAIWNYEAETFVRAIKPITDTLNFATPLIAAGLGVGLAFRVGLFNIGARGQMLIGVTTAAFVATGISAPLFIHLPLTIAAGIVGGMIWGGLVGLLKARTGANEVILTIMLNFVAFYFLSWLLNTPGLLQRPGGSQPISSPTPASAQFPSLFGAPLTVNWGFIVAIGATIFVWWLVERSSLGFRMRAVGENPFAARAAGINVERIIIYAMAFAGGLAGLAGVNQISGTITSGFGNGIDAGIGFDAITVALLGRSRAWGVFAAGILFGALKAGSFTMQVSEGIPVDIVVVVQALIVLFIAAPPLVRTIFFLPKDPGELSAGRRARRAAKAAAKNPSAPARKEEVSA